MKPFTKGMFVGSLGTIAAIVAYLGGWYWWAFSTLEARSLQHAAAQTESKVRLRAPMFGDPGEMLPPDAYLLSLKRSDQTLSTLSDFKGRVVFLTYWATWCRPCIAEMPAITSLYHHYEQNRKVAIVMVGEHEDVKTAEQMRLQFPVYEPVSKIPPELYAEVRPYTMIIGCDGRVAYAHAGAVDWADTTATEFIDKLTASCSG